MAARRLLAMAVCGGAMMLPAASAAAFESDPFNRLVNSGAEDGLIGWHGAGFGLAAYDDEIPHPTVARHDPRPIGGAQLFSAAGDAVISQLVDLSDLAGPIDAGSQDLSWGGLLGGRGGRAGGARVVIQPLDAAGAALGPPLVVGQPSDRDRQFRTALVPCYSTVDAPVGMRSVLATLQAVGHGLADRVAVSTVPYFRTAIGPPTGFAFRDADGPGCDPRELIAVPEPPEQREDELPKLRSLVSMPAPDRCQRTGALRFRVQRHWRSQVANLQVTARGKRITRAASKPIAVPAPRRTLRVAIRVRMRDGRERAGAQHFSGC